MPSVKLAVRFSLNQQTNYPQKFTFHQEKHNTILEMDTNTNKILHPLERKAIQEAEKRKKPGECLKVKTTNKSYGQIVHCLLNLYVLLWQYVQAMIDEELTNEPAGSKIIATAIVGYKLIKPAIPRTIYWQRSIQQTLVGTNNEVYITISIASP